MEIATIKVMHDSASITKRAESPNTRKSETAKTRPSPTTTKQTVSSITLFSREILLNRMADANAKRGVTVRDVDAAKFIAAYADVLKNNDKFLVPKWVDT
eukprot:gene10883-13313_t